jgi:hypothetical protein
VANATSRSWPLSSWDCVAAAFCASELDQVPSRAPVLANALTCSNERRLNLALAESPPRVSACFFLRSIVSIALS